MVSVDSTSASASGDCVATADVAGSNLSPEWRDLFSLIDAPFEIDRIPPGPAPIIIPEVLDAATHPSQDCSAFETISSPGSLTAITIADHDPDPDAFISRTLMTTMTADELVRHIPFGPIEIDEIPPCPAPNLIQEVLDAAIHPPQDFSAFGLSPRSPPFPSTPPPQSHPLVSSPPISPSSRAPSTAPKAPAHTVCARLKRCLCRLVGKVKSRKSPNNDS